MWIPLYSGLWTLFSGPVHSGKPLESGQSSDFETFLTFSYKWQINIAKIFLNTKEIILLCWLYLHWNSCFLCDIIFSKTTGPNDLSFFEPYLYQNSVYFRQMKENII